MRDTALIRRLLGPVLALSALTGIAATDAVSPPRARIVDAADQAFGLRLPDPYRWMEGEHNAEFDTWLKAQGRVGRARLDATARIGFWRERLAQVARGGVINRLQQPAGGRIFFLRLREGREGVLMVRDADGRERVLFDPAAHSSGQLTVGLTNYSPSPDGAHVAINVQHGGGEITRVEVLKVADGSPAGDAIEDIWGELAVSWLPDGSGFTYTQLAPPGERNATDPLLDERVRLHRLGTSPQSDPQLIAHGLNKSVPMELNETAILDVTEDSDFALLAIGGARPEERVCIARRIDAVKPGAQWLCPVGYDDNVQQFALHGTHLYLASMKGHPNGQLLELSAASAGVGLKSASTVVPEAATAVISGLAAASDGLYIRRLRGGPDELLRLWYGQSAAAPVPLPFPGAIYLLATDARAAGAVFTLQGWTRPRAAYLTTREHPALTDLHLGADAPADYSDITAEELSVRSADGTEVPLSLIHRKEAKPPLAEVAILEGYGAYGISLQPSFDPFVLEWVKAGHVYAVAHVRGGGEKGDAWRLAGSRLVKERGIEDFIACEQWLVAQGWSRPGKVLAWGGSAGGILVGGAITRNPKAFGAAAIQSGELNPSRLGAAKNGANQFAEVGDPSTPDGLKSLAGMDPYQRLKPGVTYPPVLLIVGLNDNRVAPWASGKFGARLMSLTGGDQSVWYRVDEDMGHFTTAQAAGARESADVYGFAEAMLLR